MISTF